MLSGLRRGLCATAAFVPNAPLDARLEPQEVVVGCLKVADQRVGRGVQTLQLRGVSKSAPDTQAPSARMSR
ncbi:MAG: hypothetical protein ACI9WU_003504, partial [Myxococcota bacterium]